MGLPLRMAEKRQVRGTTRAPLGKCQWDTSPWEAGGCALGGWPAVLGGGRAGGHRGSAEAGGR